MINLLDQKIARYLIIQTILLSVSNLRFFGSKLEKIIIIIMQLKSKA